MVKNWFIIPPLQKCEIHNKPYLRICYKCIYNSDWQMCASALDCKHCRGVYRSILPFPTDVSELIVRYIAPKLSFFHGDCKRREEFLKQFELK